MLTVPTELQTFYDTVSKSAVDNMNSTLSSLISKIGDISSACTTAQSGFSSHYESKNKAAIISNMSSIGEMTSKIKTSLSGDFQPLLSKCSEVIPKIERMIELSREVASEEEKIRIENNKKDEDKNYSSISTANSIIYKDTTEFNQIKNEANSIINALKAANRTLDIGESFVEATKDATTGEVKVELKNLKEGTYTEVHYTGDNGRTIVSYIYLPVGASTTKGLGIDLSMGGDGARSPKGGGRGGLGAGVGQQLKEGAQYSGIVVVLEAEDDSSYSDGKYLDTAKELADNLVATYHADPNKISINGYSYGGFGVVHMVERYPEYFSQAVILAAGAGPVGSESSSREEGFKKLQKTPIHLICGTKDGNYSGMNALYNGLKSAGNVTYEVRQDATHWVNTFYKTTINGKTYDNYVEFCLAQTRK